MLDGSSARSTRMTNRLHEVIYCNDGDQAVVATVW